MAINPKVTEGVMKKTMILLCLAVTLIASTQELYAGRYFVPEMARWATPDPALRDKLPNELVKIQNGKLLSTSPYGYAFDNPLRYTDPDGKTPWDIVDIAAAALSVKDFIENPTLTNALWAGADILGAAVPVVPSVGTFRHGARLLSKLDDVAGIAQGLERARELGKAGENIVQAAFNLSDEVAQVTIPSLSKTAEFRKADFLTEKTLIEVKNVKGQSLSYQLKDLMAYAKEKGLQFKLVVRKGTELSKPLQNKIREEAGRIEVEYLEDLVQ
jgi:RHS repeat-associated protein